MKSFVYALILIFSVALFYSVKQNFAQPSSIVEQTISIQTEIARGERAETNKIEKENRQMFDLLEQADQVFNESWKVILQTRSTPQSVFKSIKNAVGSQLVKRTNVKNLRCIDTEVKRTASVSGASVYQVFKTDCRQKSRNILAQYRISVSAEAEIMFYPQNLPESVGLALTVLNPKMYCRMKFDDTMLMKKMNCANLGQNFSSNKHLLMTNLLYQNNQKEVLKLSANTYENLQKEISKYNLLVPINGKIKLAEKKYDPKIIYVDAPKPVETAKDAKPVADPFNIIADNEKAPEVITKVKTKKTVSEEVELAGDSTRLPGVPGMDPNLNPNANVPEKEEANIEQMQSEVTTALEGKENNPVDEFGNPVEEAAVESAKENSAKTETSVTYLEARGQEHAGQTKVIQKNLNRRDTYIKQSAENIDVR